MLRSCALEVHTSPTQPHSLQRTDAFFLWALCSVQCAPSVRRAHAAPPHPRLPSVAAAAATTQLTLRLVAALRCRNLALRGPHGSVRELHASHLDVADNTMSEIRQPA